MSYLVSFCSCVFQSFYHYDYLAWRANLRAFRTFVRFVLVWTCRFPLPLGVWEGLWFVIVAFPGLLPFFHKHVENFTFTIVKMAKIYATFDMVVCLDAGFNKFHLFKTSEMFTILLWIHNDLKSIKNSNKTF